MPFHKLLSFFFGAGFSKWAANLPLADELFDYQITPWAREQKKLDRVKTSKSMWLKIIPGIKGWKRLR